MTTVQHGILQLSTFCTPLVEAVNEETPTFLNEYGMASPFFSSLGQTGKKVRQTNLLPAYMPNTKTSDSEPTKTFFIPASHQPSISFYSACHSGGGEPALLFAFLFVLRSQPTLFWPAMGRHQ